MTQPLPTISIDEMRRLVPGDAEAGFGALATPRGNLPLRDLAVHARVDGLVAEVIVEQTFANTLGEPLEATYIFPLPDRGSVRSFRMEVAGRVIDGVLKERAAARREYDEALAAGHRAAIAEEERPDVFTLRVGNLMPAEQARVRLTLAQPLVYADGEATFRFPLVVAPRYIPGEPLAGSSVGAGTMPDTDAVPDASRITPPVLLPGYPHSVRLAITVDVHPCGLPIHSMRSSLHSVVEEPRADGVRRVRVEPGERLNRDFVLRFQLGDDAVRTSLSVRPDTDGADGTFLLTLLPPAAQPGGAAGAAVSQRPRDVVFVLDRSGSMGGWKMVAARRAVGRMVDTLNERDRLAVYAFDSTIETPAAFGLELIAATDRNRFRAVEFLARVDARGGTEMAQPLDLAVRKLTEAVETGGGDPANIDARERILVLITDGQVGHEDHILRTIAPRLHGLRVFTLGVDRAVNEGFLRRLAVLGGGATEVVESEDRLDEVMARIHRRIGTPAVTSLAVEPAGMNVIAGSLTPARLPDLFASSPLFLMGRYRGTPGGLHVHGRDAAGRAWSATVRPSATGSDAVTAVWARARVRELEDRYVTSRGEAAEVEQQLVETSLRFGVLCRFTAFVAVDRSQVVNRGGQVHRIVQPVEMPDRWTMPPEQVAHAMRCSVMPEAHAGAGRAKFSIACRAAPAHETGPFRAIWDSADAEWAEAERRFESPGPDLAAYCTRARTLLQQLRDSGASSVEDRLLALGVLAARLAELVEDMESTGVPRDLLESLKRLIVDLCEAVARPPAAARVVELWLRTEGELERFAGTAKPVPADLGGGRDQFWK